MPDRACLALPGRFYRTSRYVRGKWWPGQPAAGTRKALRSVAAFLVFFPAPARTGVVWTDLFGSNTRLLGLRLGPAADELKRSQFLFFLSFDIAREIEDRVLGGFLRRGLSVDID